MTSIEKYEIALIVMATFFSAALLAHFPDKLSSGDMVLYASVLLLAQGLVRDLWIKYSTTRPIATPTTAFKPICMCLESSVGLLGVVAGLLMVFVGTQTPLQLVSWFWPIAIGGVLAIGFLIKDFVLDWRTRSIRREKDHQNIVFW